MKKKILIAFLVIFGAAAITGAGILITNYTSQQIDNMTLNLSDTSQNVHIKGISGTVTLNVNTNPVPDTATFWRSDTTSLRDTVIMAAHYSTRYRFSVSGRNKDTLFVILKAWRRDSQVVYPGGYYASDYLSPASRDTLIVGSITQGLITYPQIITEGR